MSARASSPDLKSKKRVAAALHNTTEVALLRTHYYKWLDFIKRRRLHTHLQRCSVSLKHNNMRRSYSRVFMQWLSCTQRNASQQAREGIVLRKDVPLRTKSDTIAVVHRYFRKWRLHLRYRKQRTIANVGALERANTHRVRQGAFHTWRTHLLTKKVEELSKINAREEEVQELRGAALRAIEAFGGSNKPRDAILAETKEDTPERLAGNTKLIGDELRNLSEDMVVVLVLTSMWSSEGADEHVSDILEKMWERMNASEKQAAEAMEAVEMTDCVMKAALQALEGLCVAATSLSGSGGAPCAPVSSSSAFSAKHEDDKMEAARARALKAVQESGNDTPLRLLDQCAEVKELLPRIRQKETELLRSAAAFGVVALGGTKGLQAVEANAAIPDDTAEETAAKGANIAEMLIDLCKAVEPVAVPCALEKSRHDGWGEDFIPPLVERLTALQRQSETLENENARMQQQLQDRDAAIKELQVQGEKLQKDLNQLEERRAAEKHNLEMDVAALDKSNKDLQQEVWDAEARQRAQEEALARHMQDSLLKVDKLEKQIAEERAHQAEAIARIMKALDQLREAARATAAKLCGAQTLNLKSSLNLGSPVPFSEAEGEEGVEAKGSVDSQFVLLNTCDATPSSSSSCPLLTEREEMAGTLQRAQEFLAAALKGVDLDKIPVLEAINAMKAEASTMVKENDTLHEHIKNMSVLNEALHDVLGTVLVMLQTPSAVDEAAVAEVAAKAQSLSEHGRATPLNVLTAVNTLRLQSVESSSQLSDGVLQADQTPLSSAELLKLYTDLFSKTTTQLHERTADSSRYEALSVFLRDIIRDSIARLRLVTSCHSPSVGSTPLSSRASLTLACHPPPLLRGEDPSLYVEYILKLENSPAESKRAVQDHLSHDSALESHDEASAPSTWEVVAEYHDRLALLMEVLAQYDEALCEEKDHTDQITTENAQLRMDSKNALAVLQGWCGTVSGGGRGKTPAAKEVLNPTQPPSVASGDDEADGGDLLPLVEEVRRTLAGIKNVAEESVNPLASTGASTVSQPDSGLDSTLTASSKIHITDLPTLLTTVETMARKLQEFRGSVADGITALGGQRIDPKVVGGVVAAGGAEDGTPAAVAVVDVDTAIGRHLSSMCQEVGDSIQEVKRMLGIEDEEPRPTAADAAAATTAPKSVTLRSILPAIKFKITELEEMRHESERLLKGLDHAFNDDADSLNSSCASIFTIGRTLKPKKKPFPALESNPGSEMMSLSHSGILNKKPRREVLTTTQGPVSVEARMRALRASARGKLDEVHDLRQTCRLAINVIEGTFVKGAKPPAYGEALVPLLITQIEEIKQALPEVEAALAAFSFDPNDKNSTSGNATTPPSAITVGTRLATLAKALQSLVIERDSLQEALDGKARQSNMILENLNTTTATLNSRIDGHRAEIEKLTEKCREVGKQLAEEQETVARLQFQREQMAAEKKETEAALVQARTRADGMEARFITSVNEKKQLEGMAEQLGREINVMATSLARALVALPGCIETTTTTINTSSSAVPKLQRGRSVGGEGQPTKAPQSRSEEGEKGAQRGRATEGEVKNALIAQLHADLKGEALATLVTERVAQGRALVRRSWADQQHLLSSLRADLEALKDYVRNAYVTEMEPICRAVLLEVCGEDTENLRVENEFLRTRALQREAFARDNKALQRSLEVATAQVEAMDEENIALRRSLAEMQVAQTLERTAPELGNNDAASARCKAAEAALAKLERRMIQGATALTTEAIVSISGEELTRVFGVTAEHTLELYSRVRQSVEELCRAYNTLSSETTRSVVAPPPTTSQRRFATSLDTQMQELRRMVDEADKLWQCIPPLLRAPYSARSLAV